MMDNTYSEKFVIVYYDTKDNRFVMVETAKNDEGYLYTLLCHKGRNQNLKNLFKVNYKGEVTPFKDLELGEQVRMKIKELTGK